MGITGLLPFLKKVSRPANIKDFKGCTVAIDSYCWLHRGAFACADKLALGEKTDQYVYYCMKYVNNLLSFGIRPIMVFDGCHLPSKRDVEKTRRERREMNRKKACQLLREGKRTEARECLQRCVDISPQMALELMNACRAKGVDCIVAPYEADAQLAYLSKTGIAQVIITEDSDLILFGCERIMFKMDFAGNGNLVEKESLNKAMDLKADCYTFEKFRYMCILSGCDYLPSLPGIGLVKANKVFKLTRQTDMNLVLRKIPTILKMSNLTVSSEYIKGFFRANNTFLYQLVYDPCKRRLIPLNPYPDDIDISEIEYAGPQIEPTKAFQIAVGNIDIYTGQYIADFDPDVYCRTFKARGKHAKDVLSMWDKNYRPMPCSGKDKDTSIVHRPSTRGKEITVKAVKVATKKRSPVKRPRPAEPDDDKDALAKELAAAYGMDEGKSPAMKRRKSEPVDTNLHHLPKNNLSLLDSYKYKNDKVVAIETEGTDVSSYQKEISVDKQPGDEVERLTNSRVKLKKTSESSLCDDEENVASDVDQPSPSPKKNRFAVLGKFKKNKFDLNAKKNQEIVKSRFFASEKPLQKTVFFNSLNAMHGSENSNANKEQGNAEEDEPIAGEPDTPPKDKPFEDSQGISTSNESESRVDTGRESPYGSFGFGKFKKAHLNSERFVEISQGANKQFKPVVHRTDSGAQSPSSSFDSMKSISSNSSVRCKHELKTSQEITCDDENKENSSQESVASFTLESDVCTFEDNSYVSTETRETTASSLHSLPGSCQSKNSISPSPEKYVSSGITRTKSVSSIFQPTKKSGFFYPKKDKTSLDCSTSLGQSDDDNTGRNISGGLSKEGSFDLTDDVSDPNPSLKSTGEFDLASGSPTSNTASGSKLLGGCRSSGLSKKAKSGLSKNTPSGKAQPAITNFFSQYAFQKGGMTKPPSLRKPLQESPDKNIPAGATPETDSLLLRTEGARVQRKLSLS